MRALFLSVLVLVAACSESFAPASAVTELRVVAAKVEVRDDPERANPSPDEGLQVSLLTIDRGAPASDVPEEPSLTPGLLQWSFFPCVPLPVTLGTPLCGPVIACEGCEGTPPEDPLATPVMQFQTPSEEELAMFEASSVLLQGIVCSNGPPAGQDAILRFLAGETDDLEPCRDEPVIEGVPVEGRFVAVTIPIEDEPSDPNLNPELLSLVLNGLSWPPPYDQGVRRDAPRTGCVEDMTGLTGAERAQHPRAGDPPSTINLGVTQESLQTFMVGDMEATEEIQVSWLADGGGFERSFSFITDPARSILTQWKPSQSVAEDGQLVRFNFVIRDGRGGTDWIQRGLCILPAEPEPSPP